MQQWPIGHLVKAANAPLLVYKIALVCEDHYKQTPEGFWFPYTITNVRGPITFTKIEANIPVDEKIFSN